MTQNLRVKFPYEGIWLLLGAAVGVLLPVRNWLSIDLRLWAFLAAALGSVVLFVAVKILRGAFHPTPQGGWSISTIVVCASADGISHQSRRVVVWAAWLFATAMVLGGVLLGQVVAIFLGLGASR